MTDSVRIHPNQNQQLEIQDEDENTIASTECESQTLFGFVKSILGKDVDSLRVSVPLFLLEPTSNLQYLADLEHVEYFAQAPIAATPIDRLIHILQLLASGFKKGLRKPKKPLNPILGELFHCEFESRQGEPKVILIGEQVSHHPPIAAFYAECPERGIETTLTFDVKAKFTAPLMNCHLKNQSHATVYIRNLGESYRIEYPNATIVGVLTMNFKLLWCGSCSVTCEKTGLKATIVFKEKRWFGRETHEVGGSIHYIHDESNPIYNIVGSWQGDMFLEDPHTKSTRPLFSCSTLQIYKQNTPPPSKLSHLESVNIWGETIALMKSGDSARANKTKSAIENRQRALEKERKAKGETWRPKYFSCKDSERDWVYIGPKTGLGVSEAANCGDKKFDDERDMRGWKIDVAETNDGENTVDQMKSSTDEIERTREGVNNISVMN